MIDMRVHFGVGQRRAVTSEWLRRYQHECDVEQIWVGHAGAASAAAGGEDLDEASANGAVCALARDEPRWRPLYWLRPGRLDSNPHVFAGAVQSEPFCGAVLAPHLNEFPLDEKLLYPYLAVAALRRMPVLVLVSRLESARPARAAALARRFPNAPFILCSAGGSAWNEAVDCVARAQQRGDATLGIDTCGASVAEIRHALATVGAGAMYFASEAAGDVEAHIRRVVPLVKDIRAAAGPQDAERILRGNAARLLEQLVPVERLGE